MACILLSLSLSLSLSHTHTHTHTHTHIRTHRHTHTRETQSAHICSRTPSKIRVRFCMLTVGTPVFRLKQGKQPFVYHVPLRWVFACTYNWHVCACVSMFVCVWCTFMYACSCLHNFLYRRVCTPLCVAVCMCAMCRVLLRWVWMK